MIVLVVALLVSTSTHADCAIDPFTATGTITACTSDELRELYYAERDARVRWQSTARQRKEYLETKYGELINANKSNDALRAQLAVRPLPPEVRIEPSWPGIAIGLGAACAALGAFVAHDSGSPVMPLLGAGGGSAACALLVAGIAQLF